ncbi:hypothetical protein DVS28_a3772 [Euzebya pacifica]|uniref:Uncharacterized protein n=1 Tax=Euzebya pacifica TaxID=1608957 RepID=A0A346Y1U7_9ACTN|nr:hypothetical protein DVS28_a3772 [Euzebya pacifica]
MVVRGCPRHSVFPLPARRNTTGHRGCGVLGCVVPRVSATKSVATVSVGGTRCVTRPDPRTALDRRPFPCPTAVHSMTAACS